MVYFEADCPVARIKRLIPQTEYNAQWFNPRTGKWSVAGEGTLKVDKDGIVQLPDFPGNLRVSDTDWALKLKIIEPQLK